MTIEDQIKDEKLQYGINREAAKISALSSGKIDKYEYLTGEELLPSKQQQIIQQAKFTYSPLGKAFEKQIKTIEDQGKKQVKAIQDKQLLSINNNNNNNNNSNNEQLLLKEREIFKDIYNKRLDEIEEMSNEIDYDELDYVALSTDAEYVFSNFKDPISLLNSIKNGEIALEEAKISQKNYLMNLKEAKVGNKNFEQK